MKVKNSLYIVLFTLLIIFIVQNIALVTVSFFFWEFTLPRSFVLAVTFVLGILGGLIFSELRRHKNKVT